MDNFYSNIDLHYPELAISLEDCTSAHRTIKCYVPILMPMINSSTPTEVSIGTPSLSNIMNKDNNLGISGMKSANFMHILLMKTSYMNIPYINLIYWRNLI